MRPRLAIAYINIIIAWVAFVLQGLPVDVRYPLVLILLAVLPLLAMPWFEKVLKLRAWEGGNATEIKHAD